MKGIFKHIFVAFAAVLTLTACDSLLPAVRTPTRSKSDSSQVSRKNSNKAQKNENYTINCDEESPLHLCLGETYTTSLYLYDNEFGGKVHIIEDSSASTTSNRIVVSHDIYYDHIEVTITAKTVGISTYDVCLVTEDGCEYTDSFDVRVDRATADARAVYEPVYHFAPMGSESIYFAIYDTGIGHNIRIDQSNPYQVTHQGQGLKIRNSDISDYNIFLTVRASNVEVTDYLEVTINSSIGDSYYAHIDYTIGTSNQPECFVGCNTNPILVKNNEFIDVNFFVADVNTGALQELDPKGTSASWSTNDFYFEFLETTSNAARMRITSLNDALVEAELYISLVTRAGFEYSAYFTVQTTNYAVDNLEMHLSYNVYPENNNWELIINVTDSSGNYMIMKDFHVYCEKGYLVEEISIYDIYTPGHSFIFDIRAHGQDIVYVDVVLENGDALGSKILVSL